MVLEKGEQMPCANGGQSDTRTNFFMLVTEPIGTFGLLPLPKRGSLEDSAVDAQLGLGMLHNTRMAEIVGKLILSKSSNNRLRQRWQSRYPNATHLVRVMSRYHYKLPQDGKFSILQVLI